MKTVEFQTRAAWRKWLSKNHQSSTEIWFVFHKRSSDKTSLDYEAVVEEALCYGWIDSLIRKIDDHRYARKLTPRKPTSRWSESNKERVSKLLKAGRMVNAGKRLVEEAKKSGLWDGTSGLAAPPPMPVEFESALSKNKLARERFSDLAPSYRNQFIGWIAAAKREATRKRRTAEAIRLLKRGEKLGLK